MSSLGNKRYITNKPAAKTELVVTPQNTPDQLLFKLR